MSIYNTSVKLYANLNIRYVDFDNNRAALLLEKLLALAKKHGYTYCCHASLAKMMRCSISTIERAIRWLKQQGLIHVQQRRCASAIIRLNYERLSTMVAAKCTALPQDNLSTDTVEEPVENLGITGLKQIQEPSNCGEDYKGVDTKTSLTGFGVFSDSPTTKKSFSKMAATATTAISHQNPPRANSETAQEILTLTSGIYKQTPQSALNSRNNDIVRVINFYIRETGNHIKIAYAHKFISHWFDKGMTYDDAVAHIIKCKSECNPAFIENELLIRRLFPVPRQDGKSGFL